MGDSDPESASSRPGWVRAHARALTVVATLLLLYALAGFLLVPHLARSAIIDYARKDLGGRHASIGQISFNPFTFTVEIHQFALTEADDRPILSFALLRVGAAMSASLVHRAWTLSEIRLEQPDVHVLIEHDGSLNLAKLAPAKSEKPEPPSSSMPAVRVGSLGVHGGSIHFEDRSRSEPFSTTLSPIEFDLTDFRTAPQFQNKYRFSAQSSAGERLDWAGEFTVRPLGSSGEFTIAALKASTIADYLQSALPCALTSGSLDLQGSYQFVATPAIAVSLKLPSIKVHSLGIAPPKTETPWITLPELVVADTAVSLEERRVSIGQITLQRSALQVWRNADGSLNLQQLMGASTNASASAAASSGASSGASSTAAPAPAPTAAAATPWNISLQRLELEDANVELEDRSVDPVFKTRLGAIGLTVQNYSSAGSSPLNIDLHLKIGDSGELRTQGSVNLAKLDSALDLSLSGLDLPALQPYVAQSTDLTVYRGRLGLKGHASYTRSSAKGKPQLQLALAIAVNDLATRDNLLNEDLVSWRELRIDGLRYQMAPDALRIDSVKATGLYGRVVIGPQGNLNVADILRPARTRNATATATASTSKTTTASTTAAADVPAAASPPAAKVKQKRGKAAPVAVAAAPAAKSATMPIRIARIDIQDSTADFTDHSIEPNFSTAIYGLKGSVVGLSSDPASRAAVSLEGSVDRYAPVSIKGQLNVLSAVTYTDIAMSFSNIELPTFNPYSGKYAGYNIAQGKLTTEMQYHVENRQLDAKHHIVVDQLEFGAATESKQAAPLPIKLAVSLLKDRNGVITIDLPVGGSLDDPTFRVGPLIWKVLVNLVTKIVTAPFAALGKLFGGGAELSYIDFPAGVATLTPEQTQKLGQLANALVERPQVKLDIPLHTQGDDDDMALERTALENALGSASKQPRPAKAAAAAPEGSERLGKLVALYRSQFKADPQYPPESSSAADPDAARVAWLEQQLLPQFAPSATDRDALGQARAQAVQQAVLANAEVKPERVFLVNQVSGGGPEAQVRMELKLE
jgi:uncharacterized protein DUF748